VIRIRNSSRQRGVRGFGLLEMVVGDLEIMLRGDVLSGTQNAVTTSRGRIAASSVSRVVRNPSHTKPERPVAQSENHRQRAGLTNACSQEQSLLSLKSLQAAMAPLR